MSYTRTLLASAALVLALAATVSVVADPGGVYRPDASSAVAYAEALRAAEHGLFWPEGSIDDRAIKQALARHAGEAACVVIGSSHAMQLGSARDARALAGPCASILNLAVSGAGLEDHLTLAWLALSRAKPEKLVLAVDPWTLAFGKDRRFSAYADDYAKARAAILGQTEAPRAGLDDVTRTKLRNLLSLEYAFRSARKLASSLRGGGGALLPAPRLDESSGGAYAAFLPDGSLVNSASYFAEARGRTVALGGDPYKTEGALNEPAAVDAYRALLAWVRRQGVEPVVVLTPYHPNVWRAPDSINARALRATEPVVRGLAAEVGARVVGSYDPEIAGCAADEFSDLMHAAPACLAKLR